jgi:uncharacterized membrane protein
MYIDGEDVLRWLHILAMVYWLGGEWGVFQTSYKVADPKLSLEERRRHMETAYRIDILARTGIIMLLPLGLHMGYNLNAQPYGGLFLVGVWIAAALWLGLCWAAFVKRDTDIGLKLTKIDEAIRFVVIPALAAAAIASLVTGAPFTANWYAAKILLYALMLCIGLALRFIMRHWVTIFRELALHGPTPALEGRLSRELALGRGLAYVYWAGIASIAFLGATKPF